MKYNRKKVQLFLIFVGLLLIFSTYFFYPKINLYNLAITEVPASLTKEQKNLLEQFKKLEDTKTNPIMKDFFK